jgi:hypothetical protein
MLDTSSLEFLQRFVDTPSPSGFERPAQEVWRAYVSAFADKVESDVQGNSIGIINEGGKPRIMLIGHCDEVGLMVRHVNDRGFVYFSSIGGVDANIAPAQRVIIHSERGQVKGVVGRVAIHMMDKDDEKKAVKMHELCGRGPAYSFAKKKTEGLDLWCLFGSGRDLLRRGKDERLQHRARSVHCRRCRKRDGHPGHFEGEVRRDHVG